VSKPGEGEWVYDMDPWSGEVIRVWEPYDLLWNPRGSIIKPPPAVLDSPTDSSEEDSDE
jgi:hypothetical protein